MLKQFLLISVLWCVIITEVRANNVYINQVGDNADIEITAIAGTQKIEYALFHEGTTLISS